LRYRGSSKCGSRTAKYLHCEIGTAPVANSSTTVYISNVKSAGNAFHIIGTEEMCPRDNWDTKPTELILLESRDRNNMVGPRDNFDTKPTELILLE
jgi:hypothetical protein